jgi:hypothetical protein
MVLTCPLGVINSVCLHNLNTSLTPPLKGILGGGVTFLEAV